VGCGDGQPTIMKSYSCILEVDCSCAICKYAMKGVYRVKGLRSLEGYVEFWLDGWITDM
jgi:hypothetical protein